jgi:ferredoxin-thioredoxin reductase catalytic chain
VLCCHCAAVVSAEVTTESKNLEVMRKFSEQYAKRCILAREAGPAGSQQQRRLHEQRPFRTDRQPVCMHAPASRGRAVRAAHVIMSCSTLCCSDPGSTDRLSCDACTHNLCLPRNTCHRSGTYFCMDKSVTAVVIQGLAEHKDTLGAPLCPCRHYDDKEAEAQMGFWNCPCVPMRERKVRHGARAAGLLAQPGAAPVKSMVGMCCRAVGGCR